MPLILVIDDEPHIRKFMRISLTANGYGVIEADTARQGITQALSQRPDLVILDLGLPDQDGQDVISTLRQTSQVPIIVLSVRSQEMDKVEALDRGANDYVAKPFGIAELMARIRAILRQNQNVSIPQSIVLGKIVIDLVRHIVTKDGLEIHLSKKEWDLLRLFTQFPDHVLTHKQILKEVWGPAHIGDTAYLRVYINQLRQKLEPTPSQPIHFVTEAGVGYRLKQDVS